MAFRLSQIGGLVLDKTFFVFESEREGLAGFVCDTGAHTALETGGRSNAHLMPKEIGIIPILNFACIETFRIYVDF